MKNSFQRYMSLLVETIRIEEGEPRNIIFHNRRMMRTMHELFSIDKQIDLLKILAIPSNAGKGIFKCRVEYDSEVRKIEYLPYSIKHVSTLKVVDCGDFSYPYKFAERREFDKLMAQRGGCDDILIIKGGMVTDTSYANVVLRDIYGNWKTPSTTLLAGTSRAFLLETGLITETPVSVNDLNNYNLIRLINAMIGIEDTVGIPIANIVF